MYAYNAYAVARRPTNTRKILFPVTAPKFLNVSKSSSYTVEQLKIWTELRRCISILYFNFSSVHVYSNGSVPVYVLWTVPLEYSAVVQFISRAVNRPLVADKYRTEVSLITRFI